MNSRHNWDADSHQILYDRIHGRGGFFQSDGAGVSGATGMQDGLADLTAIMAEAREQTEAALTKAGAVWEGDAADSMRSGVAPLAQWADDAHTAGFASQYSTEVHVNSYSTAKNQMPEPVPVTSTANTDAGGIPAAFTHLFGGQTDQDKHEAAAQEAKAEAVRVMSGYEGHSDLARSSVGEFVPPPSVVVTVPPPQPKGGDISSGGEVSGPGGASGGDGARSAGDTGGTGGGGPVSAPHRGTTPPSSTPAPPTTPSGLTPTPATPWPLTPGLVPDQPRPNPLAPVGFGPVGPPTGGGPGGGTPGRGSGSGGGVPGRGPAGPGVGGPRGGVPGVGALANEPIAGRAGSGPGATGAAGPRGAGGGMGMGPMAGGRAQGDEDEEHTSPEYLRATHDTFWDATDPVAPPVIGEDDD
jgi:hypothetical protein